MDFVIQTLGTLVQFGIGWIGFRAAKRLHVPSPAIIGALTVLGAISLAGVHIPFVPAPVAFTAKVLSGVILGQKILYGSLAFRFWRGLSFSVPAEGGFR